MMPKRKRPTTLAGRQQERTADVLSVAIAQPHRRGKKDPRSSLHGHVLGRLLHGGQLDAPQYRALQWAAWATLRYMRHITCQMPRFPSILAQELVDHDGPSDGPALKDDDVAKIRVQMEEVDEALATIRDLDFVQAKSSIMAACILDREADAGVLRVVANRLARAREIAEA